MSELNEKLRRFAREREWEQFHSPKNLSMALSVEVSELAEHFQWLSQEESRNISGEAREEVAEEIGDVLIYLTRLSDTLGIDPVASALRKVEKNRDKYPVDKARGKAKRVRGDHGK
jgi:NTP pyrophosphatase (non-canonical NTP hydrolase)